MRFVATKMPEQQSCLTLHRTRHLFIRQQTSVINAIRAHLRFSLPTRSRPHMAHSGHSSRAPQCPLSGVKRTSKFKNAMPAFDPSRKSGTAFCRDANCDQVSTSGLKSRYDSSPAERLLFTILVFALNQIQACHAQTTLPRTAI